MSWTALTVTWSGRSQKDLRGLPAKVQQQIRESVDQYAATGAGDVQKMSDGSGWRLRVRTWRVRCEIVWTAGTLTVLAVPKRGDAY